MQLTHTPCIVFLLGQEIFDQLPDTWADRISTITKQQKHLLPQEPSALRERAEAGQLFVAADIAHPDGIKIVGFAAIWDLGVDEEQRDWGEFGTVYVHPDYSFGSHPELAISVRLYAWMQASGRMALATTTNPKAMGTGQHAGLHPISFRDLPPEIMQKTCSCDPKKRRETEPGKCQLRDDACRVRVSTKTYIKLGRPPLLPLPEKPHPPSSASG
jgi:hypothetical protein